MNLTIPICNFDGLLEYKAVWDKNGDRQNINYTYNSWGSVEKIIYPDGGYIEYDYTGLPWEGLVPLQITDYRDVNDRPGDEGSVFTYQYYWPSGKAKSFTDCNNYTVNYDYSLAYGQKTHIDVADPNGQLLYDVNYVYDKAGRLVDVCEPMLGADNLIAGFEYDKNGNRSMFTGREFDYETGLYYYRARHYSPKLGRFLQADPIGYAGGLNLYTYCHNNPVNYWDPYGLFDEECEDNSPNGKKPQGLDTIGIHANPSHAWISYTNGNGQKDTYGLWHLRWGSKHRGNQIRKGSDVWHNNELSAKPSASRYYNNVTPEQEKRFKDWLDKPHKYRYPTNNCSSWASDTYREVTGEDIDADDGRFLGVETPDELIDSIQDAEKKDPTKNENEDKDKNKKS